MVYDRVYMAVFMLSGIASQNAPQNWAFATQTEI